MLQPSVGLSIAPLDSIYQAWRMQSQPVLPCPCCSRHSPHVRLTVFVPRCSLTFLTPTLLAGDRSLVDVVFHEACHSWFGNNVVSARLSEIPRVTLPCPGDWLNVHHPQTVPSRIPHHQGCKDWSNFWLNEGWTTYCERLLVRQKEGEAGRGFSYIIGRKALHDSLKGYEKKGEKRYQRLVVPFEFGDDPDGERMGWSSRAGPPARTSFLDR